MASGSPTTATRAQQRRIKPNNGESNPTATNPTQGQRAKPIEYPTQPNGDEFNLTPRSEFNTTHRQRVGPNRGELNLQAQPNGTQSQFRSLLFIYLQILLFFLCCLYTLINFVTSCIN